MGHIRPASNPPQQQRRADRERLTRESLHGAAIRVITQGGLEGLTMERVAREAGLAKGTLYLYFKSKQALIDASVQAVMKPLTDELIGLLEGPLPPEEKLRRLPRLHLGYFEKNRSFFRILLYERDLAQGAFRRRRSEGYRKFLGNLARVVREGSRQKIFRPLDASKVAAMFAESSIALIHRRLWSDRAGPLEDDAALLAGLFLDGLKRKEKVK